MKNAKSVLFLIWIMLPLLLWASDKRNISEERELAKDGMVEIENVSGSVTVTGWNESKVKITGTLEKDVKEVKISGDRQRLKIDVKLVNKRHNTHGDAFLNIFVPEKARLEINTVSADIEVKQINNERMEVESVSGYILINAESEDLSVSTVSGDITAEVKAESAGFYSVSGSLEIEGNCRRLTGETVSGNIEIDNNKSDDIVIKSTSGSLTFKGDIAKKGRLKAKSLSGSVKLYLPENISAEFELSTFSGSLKNRLTDDYPEKSSYGPGKDLEFSLNGGSATIKAESFSGSVKLEKVN